MVDRLYNARIDYKDEVKRALLKKPSRPPTCPVPLPYAAYSTGRLGTTTGDLGQNGWWVAPTTYTTEEITSAVYHDGGQAWWIGDCEDICSAPLFAAYPGPGLGGFGNGIAAEYPLAPANRVRVSLWIKSTSDLPVGGGGSGIVEFCLDGADSSTNTLPLTSFRFGNVYGDDVLVAQAREVTGGTVGNPNSVSRTSLPLTAGRWYHLIMDASLVKGELNDRVKYEVRDTLGNTVWKAEILSLEQAYWLNVSP